MFAAVSALPFTHASSVLISETAALTVSDIKFTPAVAIAKESPNAIAFFVKTIFFYKFILLISLYFLTKKFAGVFIKTITV